MLCHCSTHPVTKKRDHIAVIGPRVTERHTRSYCARTRYGEVVARVYIGRSGLWCNHPAHMTFERIDR